MNAVLGKRFSPLPWQKKCLEEFTSRSQNSNLLLIAPTSAGKTFVAAELMLNQVLRGVVCLYVVPYIAVARSTAAFLTDTLSPHDLRAVAAHSGIQQGNNTLHHPDVAVVVATIETAYALLADAQNNFQMVVVDECHMLGDRDKGHLVESICSYFQFHQSQIILMSATYPSCDNTVKWLNLKVFKVEERPVSLHHCAICPNGAVEPGAACGGDDNVNLVLPQWLLSPRERLDLVALCRHCLSEDKNVVVFAYSRAEVVKLANELTQAGLDADYHHAKRTLEEKESVEKRFQNRQLKVLCSTRTLATGVNLPAAIVIITSSLINQFKSDDEYWQVAGRCGRLGYDKAGLCISMCTNIKYLKMWRRFQTPTFNGMQSSSITANLNRTASFILWGKRCGLFNTKGELLSLLHRICPLTPTAEDTVNKALLDVTSRKLCDVGGDTIKLLDNGAAVSSCGYIGYQEANCLLKEIVSFRETPIIIGSRLQVLFLLTQKDPSRFFSTTLQVLGDPVVIAARLAAGLDACDIAALKTAGGLSLLSRRFIQDVERWEQALLLLCNNQPNPNTNIEQCLWRGNSIMAMCRCIMGYKDVEQIVNSVMKDLQKQCCSADVLQGIQNAFLLKKDDDARMLYSLNLFEPMDVLNMSFKELDQLIQNKSGHPIATTSTYIHNLALASFSRTTTTRPPLPPPATTTTAITLAPETPDKQQQQNLTAVYYGVAFLRPLEKELVVVCSPNQNNTSTTVMKVTDLLTFISPSSPHVVLVTAQLKQSYKHPVIRQVLKSYKKVLDVDVMHWLTGDRRHNNNNNMVTLTGVASLRDGQPSAEQTAKTCMGYMSKLLHHPPPSLVEREHTIIGILADMEMRGINVDTSALTVQHDHFCRLMEDCLKNIPEQCDPMCPDSVREHLGLEKHLSTNKETLQKIGTPEALAVASYRSSKKRVDEATQLIRSSVCQKVHCQFLQLYENGRIQTERPNLIGITSEIGRCLCTSPGKRLLRFDYKHIELRIVACLSGCSLLQSLFRMGTDPFLSLAAQLQMSRQSVKEVVYACLYGSSLKKEREEVREHIFKLFEGVQKWKEEAITTARAQGFVVTALDRFKRVIHNLSSTDIPERRSAERVGINAIIQGTASDILKRALIIITHNFQTSGVEKKWGAAILLTRHDEVVVECDEKHVQDVRQNIVALMSQCAPELSSSSRISFPVEVSVS